MSVKEEQKQTGPALTSEQIAEFKSRMEAFRVAGKGVASAINTGDADIQRHALVALHDADEAITGFLDEETLWRVLASLEEKERLEQRNAFLEQVAQEAVREFGIRITPEGKISDSFVDPTYQPNDDSALLAFLNAQAAASSVREGEQA